MASRPATPKPLGTTWSLQFVAKRNISWLSCCSRVKRDVRMRELITQYIPLAVRGRTQTYVRKPRFEQGVQPGDASIGNL